VPSGGVASAGGEPRGGDRSGGCRWRGRGAGGEERLGEDAGVEQPGSVAVVVRSGVACLGEEPGIWREKNNFETFFTRR
jgi:hypothetical protein